MAKSLIKELSNDINKNDIKFELYHNNSINKKRLKYLVEYGIDVNKMDEIVQNLIFKICIEWKCSSNEIFR